MGICTEQLTFIMKRTPLHSHHSQRKPQPQGSYTHSVPWSRDAKRVGSRGPAAALSTALPVGDADSWPSPQASNLCQWGGPPQQLLPVTSSHLFSSSHINPYPFYVYLFISYSCLFYYSCPNFSPFSLLHPALPPYLFFLCLTHAGICSKVAGTNCSEQYRTHRRGLINMLSLIHI